MPFPSRVKKLDHPFSLSLTGNFAGTQIGAVEGTRPFSNHSPQCPRATLVDFRLASLFGTRWVVVVWGWAKSLGFRLQGEVSVLFGGDSELCSALP